MTRDQCPACPGRRHRGHPAGPLVISHASDCRHGAAEDSRKVADAAMATEHRRRWTRTTTDTERVLLAHVFDVDPATVPGTAELHAVAGSAVIARHWPALYPPEGDTPA